MLLRVTLLLCVAVIHLLSVLLIFQCMSILQCIVHLSPFIFASGNRAAMSILVHVSWGLCAVAFVGCV